MNPQIAFLLNKSLESLRNSNLESAELYLKQALRFQSSNPHVLRLLGVIAAQRGRHSEAKEYLNDSLKALPRNPLALANLGNVFLGLKDYENALNTYDQSIKIDPKYEEAWSNKGNVLYELKRYDEALAHHDKALSLRPDYAEAWSNKGNVLYELKRYDEALAHQDKALSLRPDYAEAWYNKGVILYEQKNIDLAIVQYDKALSLRPNYYDATWNKSLAKLLQGDFDDGLSLYESRWLSEKALGGSSKRWFGKPVWLGQDSLQGKAILLYGEQGLGDFIQFCRYTKLVAELGARVILEVPETLATLLEGLDGVSQLIIKGQELPPYDYHCPILSLPLALKTNLSNIPSGDRYLNLDSSSNKVIEWEKRVGSKTKPRIGLVWSGNAEHTNDHNRSLLLSNIIPYLPDYFEYISLQKEIREVDKLTLISNPRILSFANDLHDFSDTAALIHCLDLVISVDTSVAHLSGALGKESWVLLPFVPDWRWLLDRDDSPWYASTKLYRQPAAGDWNSVLNEVKLDLEGR